MPKHKPTKAYQNAAFLDSRHARILRIQAEYLETEKRIHEAGIKDTIVFFGSARTLPKEEAEANLAAVQADKTADPAALAKAERDLKMSHYYEVARDLSFRLTKWAQSLTGDSADGEQRFSIVTGGGPGMMEAANRGAHEAGGTNIGMNISLPFEQYPNDYITEGLAFEFHYFFVRKFWLVYLSKAAVVMPGGYGTLDEFMEVLTLVQTEKIRRKLPIVLIGKEFWTKTLNLAYMAECGTINPDDLNLFHITDSAEEAFNWLKERLAEWAIDHPGAGLTGNDEGIGQG